MGILALKSIGNFTKVLTNSVIWYFASQNPLNISIVAVASHIL